MTTKSSFDWSQFEEIPSSSSSKSFDWSSFEEIPEKSRGFRKRYDRSVGEKVANALGTAMEKPSLIATEFPTAGVKAAENIASIGNPLTGLVKSIAEKFGVEPTPELSQMVSEYFRKDLPEQYHEGAEDIADVESFLFPLPIKGKEAVTALGKLPSKLKPSAKIAETFESGLTKPRAVEAKKAHLGIITPARQTEVLEGLEKEARGLTKKAVEKHIPLSKQIEEGFDFEKKFERDYGRLRSVAKKFNPEVDVESVFDFLSKTSGNYKGIPKPHPEAVKIIGEIKALRSRPPGDLVGLEKIYRSNNKKIKNIYETSRLKGKQQEYVDFLLDMNRKIVESFEKTLPQDSLWIKKFKEANANYHEYINTKDTLSMLEPILGDKMDTDSLRKLAFDRGKQAKLRLKMGEEGAEDIIQIGKDLNLAVESIKRMPAKEIGKFDAYYPLALLIPGFGKAIGGVAAVAKGVTYAKRAWGWYLSNPARRKIVDKALHAIEVDDIELYKEATKELKKITQ
jgi:hypothetical protein